MWYAGLCRVAVAEYAVAVAVAGLCCVICRTMLCDMQDYTRVSAGLCDMVYNTTLYGIQY